MKNRIMLFLLVLLGLTTASALPTQAANRVIDDNDRIVMSGNVHHDARAEYDA